MAINNDTRLGPSPDSSENAAHKALNDANERVAFTQTMTDGLLKRLNDKKIGTAFRHEGGSPGSDQVHRDR